MSIGTVAFNDVANSGYSSSVRSPGGNRDIMTVWDPYKAPAPSDDFYENKDYGGGGTTIAPDPIYGEEQQSFTQSLIEGNTREETLMETMFPDKNYSGPKIDAQSMKRDANKVVTDGAKVSRQANMAMEETKEKIAEFKEDWKQAKTEAVEAFVESAKEMGVDPLQAADQMIPGDSPGKSGAMMAIAAEMIAGGGTMATAGKAFYMNQELSKADQKLTPDQQRSLLEDMQKRLVESTKPADTRMEASTSGAGAEVEAPPESEIAWENMEIDDLAEFLGADSEGMDQPEMQELLLLEHELEEVLDNHEYVQEHYADVVTADKMYASAAAGNEKMTEIVMDAEVVQAMPVTDEVPKYDSLDAMLAGDSVRGVTLLASDTRFDSSGVQTYLDITKVDVPEVKRQLTADIEQQFMAGMR